MVRDDAWLLYDAKSANGTQVNGTKIPPGEGVEVKSGSIVIFGHLPVEMISALDLYDAL